MNSFTDASISSIDTEHMHIGKSRAVLLSFKPKPCMNAWINGTHVGHGPIPSECRSMYVLEHTDITINLVDGISKATTLVNISSNLI